MAQRRNATITSTKGEGGGGGGGEGEGEGEGGEEDAGTGLQAEILSYWQNNIRDALRGRHGDQAYEYSSYVLDVARPRKSLL